MASGPIAVFRDYIAVGSRSQSGQSHKVEQARRAFYYVFIRNEPDFALAKSSADPDLDRQLRAGGQVSDWSVRSYQLEEGVVIDYLPNSDAFRMCSDRLRDVLDHERGDGDVLQWLQAVVTDPGGGDLTYWVLHFPESPDVINRERSIFSGGDHMIKAVLDMELVVDHRVFSFPHNSVSLVISDSVRRAIGAAGCGGMEFSRVPIA